MPNKNKNKSRRVAVKQPKSSKKPTPFSDAGGIVGSKLGTMFNAPYLKGVGKWLGSGIGQIFGSGDYQMVGAMPDYNVLMNGNQIPKFSNAKQTNIVCHREYLGDFTGTATFSNNLFPLNPGFSKTFPWLSTIAQNYQEYKFHGLIFEFRPLITDFVTNGAPGVVVMATNYNADSPPYTSKQEMENSEYAVSVKPTRELMHGVECASVQTVLPQLYVRTGAVPAGQDLRLYDLGLFQFATQTNPVQNLGELWVSYCVEFFKPVLPLDVGGNVLGFLTNRASISAGSPFGTISVNARGDLPVTITTNSFTWLAQPGNYYYFTVYWTGSIAAVVTYPAFTLGPGLLALSEFNGAQNESAPPNGVTSSTMMTGQVVLADILQPNLLTVTLGLAGVMPTGTTSVTIIITSYSSEAVL